MASMVLKTLAAALIPALTQLQATKPSDRETVLTRTFAAPRQTVFDALTQPNHLVRWMKPPNMSLVACELDLRAGGSFRHLYQRSNGASIEVRAVSKTVEPPIRSVYTETYDFSPLQMLVTTTLGQVAGDTVSTQTMVYASKQERADCLNGVVAAGAAA